MKLIMSSRRLGRRRPPTTVSIAFTNASFSFKSKSQHEVSMTVSHVQRHSVLRAMRSSCQDLKLGLVESFGRGPCDPTQLGVGFVDKVISSTRRLFAAIGRLAQPIESSLDPFPVKAKEVWGGG